MPCENEKRRGERRERQTRLTGGASWVGILTRGVTWEKINMGGGGGQDKSSGVRRGNKGGDRRKNKITERSTLLGLYEIMEHVRNLQ